MLSCLHQVNSANQMRNQKGDSNVYNILLEQMEKGISPESTSKTDMEKEGKKTSSWLYRFAER